MSGDPGASSICPLCDKPVAGRTALLGHLEFGHEVADPESYLTELEQPAGRSRRSLGPAAARVARIAGAVVILALVGAGGVVGYRALAADESSNGSAPPSTSAPVATTTESTTTASTTTASTTTTTTTTATTTTAAAAEDVPFRVPFLVDAEAVGCTRRGDVEVHEFRFEFSGALNITFDGAFYPDDTGDGPHTSTHELPAGTDAYLDQVVVEDPSGEEHRVEIDPPLYLGAC